MTTVAIFFVQGCRAVSYTCVIDFKVNKNIPKMLLNKLSSVHLQMLLPIFKKKLCRKPTSWFQLIYMNVLSHYYSLNYYYAILVNRFQDIIYCCIRNADDFHHYFLWSYNICPLCRQPYGLKHDNQMYSDACFFLICYIATYNLYFLHWEVWENVPLCWWPNWLFRAQFLTYWYMSLYLLYIQLLKGKCKILIETSLAL